MPDFTEGSASPSTTWTEETNPSTTWANANVETFRRYGVGRYGVNRYGQGSSINESHPDFVEV